MTDEALNKLRDELADNYSNDYYYNSVYFQAGFDAAVAALKAERERDKAALREAIEVLQKLKNIEVDVYHTTGAMVAKGRVVRIINDFLSKHGKGE